MERRERTTTKVKCMVRGYNDYRKYTPPHPKSKAAAVSSYLEPAISFAFGLRYAGAPLKLRG